MRLIHALLPLTALTLAACATTAATEEEQAVIDTMNANTIVPASTAERQAIRSPGHADPGGVLGRSL